MIRVEASSQPGALTGGLSYVTKLAVRRNPDATGWVGREKSAEVNRAIRECPPQ